MRRQPRIQGQQRLPLNERNFQTLVETIPTLFASMETSNSPLAGRLRRLSKILASKKRLASRHTVGGRHVQRPPSGFPKAMSESGPKRWFAASQSYILSRERSIPIGQTTRLTGMYGPAVRCKRTSSSWW